MTDFGDEFETVELGNPAGFVARYISQGASATEALSEYRAAGGSMRTQTWYQLYGEVADTIARRGTFGITDPGALPDSSDYGEWTMGRGGQYATQVQVHFRDRETGLLGSKPFTHITDEPHTPDEAAMAAIDEYADGDNDQQYDQVILGAVSTAGWVTRQYGA